MALLSATTLRTDYLPDVASSDANANAVLARALQRAEDLVSRYLGYPGTSPTWASTSYTLRLAARRSDTSRLLLPVAPVTAITSVYQDTTMAFAASSLVDSGDYELESLRNGAYLRLLPDATVGSWSTAARVIKVTCTAGYANEAAVPDDLAHAVYGWVADWWMKRRVRHLETGSQGGASQSFAAGGQLPDDVREIADAYLLLGTFGGLS